MATAAQDFKKIFENTPPAPERPAQAFRKLFLKEQASTETLYISPRLSA